jgi:hypothetical protein
MFDIISVIFGSLYIHHRFETDFGYFIPFWICAFFSGFFRFLLVLVSPSSQPNIEETDEIETFTNEDRGLINEDPDEITEELNRKKEKLKKKKWESRDDYFRPFVQTQEEYDAKKQNLIQSMK